MLDPVRAEDELEPGDVGAYKTKQGIDLTVSQAIARYGDLYSLPWSFDRGDHTYQLWRGLVDALTGEVIYVAPGRIR